MDVLTRPVSGVSQRQVFSALSHISKHSVSLAEMVVEADVFPAAVACLRDPDEYVRKNVSTLMREVAKHSPEVPNPEKIRTFSAKLHVGSQGSTLIQFELLVSFEP